MVLRASFRLDFPHPLVLDPMLQGDLGPFETAINDFNIVVKPLVKAESETVDHGDEGTWTYTAKFIVCLLVDVTASRRDLKIDRKTHIRFDAAAASAVHQLLKHLRRA